MGRTNRSWSITFTFFIHSSNEQVTLFRTNRYRADYRASMPSSEPGFLFGRFLGVSGVYSSFSRQFIVNNNGWVYFNKFGCCLSVDDLVGRLSIT